MVERLEHRSIRSHFLIFPSERRLCVFLSVLSQLTTSREESGIIVTPVKRIADKRWRWHGRPVSASKMWEVLTEGCWRACVTSLADTAPWRFCAGCKLTSPYRAWIFPTPRYDFRKIFGYSVSEWEIVLSTPSFFVFFIKYLFRDTPGVSGACALDVGFLTFAFRNQTRERLHICASIVLFFKRYNYTWTKLENISLVILIEIPRRNSVCIR